MNHSPAHSPTLGVRFFLRGSPDTASARVRGVEVAAALRAMGIGADTIHPHAPRWRAARLASLISPRIVVVQKRANANDVRLVRARRRLGRATIFDVDDAPGGVGGHDALEARVRSLMRTARTVSVGSEALGEYASRLNPDVVFVPSAVDTAVFSPRLRTPRGDDAVPVVGWVGNGPGYARELERLAGWIAAVRRRVRIRVVVVGAMGRRDIHGWFSHADDTVVDAVDWTCSITIARAVAEFDIGVYPLDDTLYNGFKCAYKAVQYMAVGLPVVASPVGEIRRVVRNGGSGVLARTDAEWCDAICRLAGDSAARNRMGREGRAIVESRYAMTDAARTLAGVIERI